LFLAAFDWISRFRLAPEPFTGVDVVDDIKDVGGNDVVVAVHIVIGLAIFRIVRHRARAFGVDAVNDREDVVGRDMGVVVDVPA
jgi:hypothetical protein